jgi:hypothetical protein
MPIWSISLQQNEKLDAKRSEHPIGHHAREPEVIRRVGQCLNLVSRDLRRVRLPLGEQVRQRPIPL